MVRVFKTKCTVIFSSTDIVDTRQVSVIFDFSGESKNPVSPKKSLLNVQLCIKSADGCQAGHPNSFNSMQFLENLAKFYVYAPPPEGWLDPLLVGCKKLLV